MKYFDLILISKQLLEVLYHSLADAAETINDKYSIKGGYLH